MMTVTLGDNRLADFTNHNQLVILPVAKEVFVGLTGRPEDKVDRLYGDRN